MCLSGSSNPSRSSYSSGSSDSFGSSGTFGTICRAEAKSNYPWYGIDYSGGQATGRFWNGRTIGVNYASGGAGILNDTGLYFIQRLSFDDQIKNFKKTKEVITANIREVAANKHFNEATFFIGIGSNDYVNNFLQPFLPDGQQYTHEEFTELLISTLDQQLQNLIIPESLSTGSTKNSLPWLGPLGCIPSQRVKSKSGQCLKRVNEWILQYNSNVQKLITRLNHRLPNAKFIFADTYPSVLDLINNPSTYGQFDISST
ncbi:zeta-carotene desaturase [Vigna unguiculata]|uniref:Zeta-carotene desaturase n=1 Tax=Vigna unguiculata TaxID=3917 RepID=A0A4D6MKP1_VIGUN|nr:zeta-carotene desaturase [Vigna unguiculata]